MATQSECVATLERDSVYFCHCDSDIVAGRNTTSSGRGPGHCQLVYLIPIVLSSIFAVSDVFRVQLCCNIQFHSTLPGLLLQNHFLEIFTCKVYDSPFVKACDVCVHVVVFMGNDAL